MTPLPVASEAQVRRAAANDVRADRALFIATLLLIALAAGAGLVGPWLLGEIVNTVVAGEPNAVATVDRLAFLIVAFTVAQILLTRYALYVGTRFGERAAARIRVRFVDRVLGLPAGVAEQAGSGDLLARGTTDITTVAITLRSALPTVVVSGTQALLILVAVFFVNPLLGLCGLLCPLIIAIALRWYLRRARSAYLASGAANSTLAETLAATAAGARTVEALGLQQRRRDTTEAAIAVARRAQLRTLWLRTMLFPSVDMSYLVPLVGVLIVGGVLYYHQLASVGAVVAATVYLRQLVGPLDSALTWVDQLQSGGASYARVEGLAAAPSVNEPSSAVPADDRIDVTRVRFAYPNGQDVLHDVDLKVRPGERLAIVGPSGAGKSTLGRLLAGVEKPGSGSVTVGGVPIADLAPDRLRRQVVLVTQEHHVFRDTLRGNLLIANPAATDDELLTALRAVHATWIDDLADGLDTDLGSETHRLDGAEAQQLSLARIVLADPHTLVLDEATALLDPTTARDTERALASVLQGRTVVAIAHRLATAHDADRIAMMSDGAITELGTHDELVANNGAYGALWRSWHGGGA
jgi:ATP-binding cassette subfamily C protein